jgi:proline dehydrogenase
MERYNHELAVVYNTYQLYRTDKLAHLQRDYEKARREGYILGAKLVRGAYLVKERTRAKEMGYPSPIQPDRVSTDRAYNDAIRFCVDNYQHLASCNASHNLESNLLQAELIAEKNLPRSHPHLNFCQLMGMSDNITFNLSAAGFNVAKYVVYGPIREVVPYLIRRAHENASVTGDMSRELALIVTEMQRRGI